MTHPKRQIARRRTSAGGSLVEFMFVTLMLVPMFLGGAVLGVDLIRTLQTIQLARDAGHMYARGVDFSQPGNDTILYQLGSSLGLSSSSSSSSLVILSNLLYIDASQCLALGLWNVASATPNGCTNYQQWVFTQRLEFGNTAMRASNLGSPVSGAAPGDVTIAPGTGKISQMDYVTKTGAVATFNGINPYATTNGVASGLPSGQTLYVAEAAAAAWQVKPFFGNALTYSFGLF